MTNATWNGTKKKGAAKAIEIGIRFGGIDGDHHKSWVIDQMLRALLGSKYEKTIADSCAGDDGPNTYTHDEGTPP